MESVRFLLVALALVALCPSNDAGFRFLHRGHGHKHKNCGKHPDYVIIHRPGKPHPPRPTLGPKPAKPAVATPTLKPTTLLGALTNTQILTCHTSTPGAVYTFYKNGKKVKASSKGRLVLKNLGPAMAGKYTCAATAKGKKSKPSKVYDLKIQVAKPVAPDCVPEVPAGGLVPGGHFSLSCKSPIAGKKTYTFYKDGKKIRAGSNPKLLIQNLNKSKSGKYSCTVTVNGKTSPMGPAVVVHIKSEPPTPNIVPAKTGHDLNSGGHQTLTCETSAKGKKTYVFYKNGKKIRENGNHELELNSLDKSEAGKYCCVVKVDGVPSKKSPAYELTVESVTIYQPHLTPKHPKSEMPAGLDQILTCKTKNTGDVLYTFLKNGEVIQKGKNHVLNVQDLSPADDGKYACFTTMAGHDSHHSHPYNLKVKVSLDRPTLTCSCTSSHVWVDESLTMTCGSKVTKGMTFIYYKDGKEIHKGASNKFAINKVKAGDKGVYTCATVLHGHKSEPSQHFPIQVMAHCDAHVDLLFLVDKSASIKPDQFKIAKSFIQKMVAKFVVKPDVVRVGTVLFANGPHNGFCFNKYTSNAAVNTAIGSLSCPKCKRGKTATAAALQYARENSLTDACGAREDAKKIIVVITDGKSTEKADYVEEQAEEMKMIADEVITVGVGKFKRSELEMIATQDEFVFTTDDFSKLEGMLNNVATKTCEAGAAGADVVTEGEDEDYEDVDYDDMDYDY